MIIINNNIKVFQITSEMNKWMNELDHVLIKDIIIVYYQLPRIP